MLMQLPNGLSVCPTRTLQVIQPHRYANCGYEIQTRGIRTMEEYALARAGP
jgi:hypothetical protein